MRSGKSYIFLFRGLMMLIFLCLFGLDANAQYYSTGQEPASIRWKKIKTEHFKIVFPDYYEENARKLVGYLDTVYGYSSASLDYYPKRISLLLHTQSAKSNAVVVWAPKRIEFYTTPPQEMYAQPWLQQLSLHEYRHVVQTEKLNQGLTKVISWIFGQQGTGAILGLYVPMWFLEGDAVATETGLSFTGRGRVPLFEMKMRTQILANGAYSYDKATMGSYKDFVPNEYELGYLLVTEGRRNYGSEIWEHSLNMVGRRPYMITPFQKGIKDASGKRKVAFYNECLDGLEERWRVQENFAKPDFLSEDHLWTKVYTDYRHPYSVNNSGILSLKTSLDGLPRFIITDNEGKENVVHKPGFMKTETLSYAAGKVCWVESFPDLRWSNRSYTIIKIFDLESGEAYKIKHKQRIFAPSLSPDATSIVAVKIDSLNNYAIVIIDAESGKIKKKMPSPGNAFPMTPVWAGNDLVLAVLISEDGKNIAKFDVTSGRSKTLLNWEYTDISQPVFYSPYIYYTGGYSGISNIYALDIEEGGVFKVTSAKYGAVDPQISKDGKTLYFADYTPNGYRIRQWPLEPRHWVDLNNVYDGSIGLYKVLESQEEVVPPGSSIAPSDAPAKKYSKIANLFNFHSWAPLDINANNYTIHPGVSIASQNLLSSSFVSAGYSYNLNEEAGQVYATYSYQGWYPVIDLSIDHGLRRQTVYLPEATEVSWNETNLTAGLSLPLNLTRGRYYAGITPSIYANQGFRRIKEGSPVDFKKSDIFSTGYSLNLYRQIRMSHRDIYPKWGQSMTFYFKDTPFDKESFSYILAGIGSFYFPGFFKQHGLNIYTGYQYREIGYYKFSGLVSYPRGITGAQDQELISLKATYALPIAYPDWSIGPVLYMKRIRANLFYDYAIGYNPHIDNYYQSTGIDLITEVHILRFLAPIELGLRSIYLPDESKFDFSFLFGIGL